MAEVKTSKGLKHDFTLRTPVSTAAVKGTVFKSSASGDLEVETGKIKHSNKIGQSVSIRGGASSSIKGNGYKPPETERNSFDDFHVDPSTLPYEAIQFPDILPKELPETGSIIVDWDKPGLPDD